MWRLYHQLSQLEVFCKKEDGSQKICRDKETEKQTLLVCFGRVFSSFGRHLSLHWQKNGARDANDLGMEPIPAGSIWRCHVQMCPESAPSHPHSPDPIGILQSTAISPTQALRMFRKSSCTVGIHLQPLKSATQLQPLALPSA